VYASINGGASWSRFAPGFPDVQVVQLQLNPTLNILAAGTHGRGMWEVAVAHFQVTPSGTAEQAGTPFSVTVTAEDPFNRPLTSYAGKVHFVSTDHLATLPMDFTFGPADHGMRLVQVTLRTPGSQIIRISDVTEIAVTGTTTVTVVTTASLNGPAGANSLDAGLGNLNPFDVDSLFASNRWSLRKSARWM
jgi:hypothetical protein